MRPLINKLYIFRFFKAVASANSAEVIKLIVIRQNKRLALTEVNSQSFVALVRRFIVTENLLNQKIGKQIAKLRVMLKKSYRDCLYSDVGIIMRFYKLSSL